MPLSLETLETDGAARTGRITTPRGSFKTPCFMPVGTRGAVVHLDASDYEDLGAQVILGNTYHLMMRPGAEVVAALGDLHGFSDWSGHMLTDSGGYQVMSLDPKVDDEGVTFRSVYDGDLVRLTPEKAVGIQELLGADIQMVLDVCSELPASPKTLRTAMDRTHAWAARAKNAQERDDQALFGIVQGGVDVELRAESATILADLDFVGYGIGGLSVGEPRHEMLPALEAAIAPLPVSRPRYLMGVGDPASLVEAVALGVDMFDCVLPTRLARHGGVLTSAGKLNIRNAKFLTDDAPLDPRCECKVCKRFSRGYLRHLLSVKEPTAGRLITLHNLSWLLGLVEQMQEAIAQGELEAMRKEVLAIWG